MASVKACLRNYWQAPKDAVIEDMEMADWLSALEDWSVSDVQDALRKWVMDNPSRRPNFGHIAAALKDKRGREFAASIKPAPEPERERITPERAAEIIAEIGISIPRFGA